MINKTFYGHLFTLEMFFIGCEKHHKKHPDLRKGQSAMNYLHNVRPLLHDAILGTEKDCFYLDDRWNDFVSFIEDNWDQPAKIDNEHHTQH